MLRKCQENIIFFHSLHSLTILNRAIFILSISLNRLFNWLIHDIK